MVPKVLTMGIMRQLRNAGWLFAFVLLVVATSLSAGAALTHDPSLSVPFQPNGTHIDRLLPLSITGSEGQSAGDMAITASIADQAGAPAALYLLASTDDGNEQVPDADDVVRHRGFAKALLIILVCGALIRILTSPAYLKFIADVLDPKAF